MPSATNRQQSDQVLSGLGAQFDTSPLKNSGVQDMNRDLQQISAETKKESNQASINPARRSGRC